jgi:hypothetical protein
LHLSFLEEKARAQNPNVANCHVPSPKLNGELAVNVSWVCVPRLFQIRLLLIVRHVTTTLAQSFKVEQYQCAP